MSVNMKDLKFTKDHEWVRIEEEIAIIGISDYAQKELGDTVEKGDVCSNIESVKAVSDLYCPVTGEIVEANEILEDAPEKVNKSPYGDGWIFKVRIDDSSQLDELMNSEQYEKYLEGILKE